MNCKMKNMSYIPFALGHSIYMHRKSVKFDIRKYFVRWKVPDKGMDMFYHLYKKLVYNISLLFSLHLGKKAGVYLPVCMYFMCLITYKTRHFLHVDSYHGRKKIITQAPGNNVGFVSILFKIREVKVHHTSGK